MPGKIIYNHEQLPDLLPIYYKRIFPFNEYYKWLCYGNVQKNYFAHREFSFTLEDDIYVRYQSFKDQEEMESEIRKKCPHKIDIGAVFSFRPKDHRTVSVFTPKEKEVVFDIDMTDYDDVRYCCSGTDICDKCWKYMAIAVKVIDASLREDYGFSHILWVYSGRRGVHCWVCDASARALSQSARSAIAEYLQIIRGGAEMTKKVNITSNASHPLIKRSEAIIEKYVESVCVEDQEMFESVERWNKVLCLIPDQDLRETLQQVMKRCNSPMQRWNTINSELNKIKNGKISLKKGVRPHLRTEILFQLLYPRLDINVSKQLNHLLKSPFCVHPKTGRICIPFHPQKVDEFSPSCVPTVADIIEEINSTEVTTTIDSHTSTSAPHRPPTTWKKTSLKECMAVFEDFLHVLHRENSAIKRDNSDATLEF